jgi:hypothetical protein
MTFSLFRGPESFHRSLPEGDRDSAQALPTRALIRLLVRQARENLPAASTHNRRLPLGVLRGQADLR